MVWRVEKTEVRAELAENLATFRAVLLEAPEVPPVHLHCAITVQIVRVGRGFACMLVELCVSARAEDPQGAFAAAINKLRNQVDHFRRAPTHTLDPDARAQKQRLLGGVDLVASGLLGEVPETTWILGKFVAGEGGTMRVREVGSHARTFDLDPSVEAPLLPDAHPRLVRVRTGKAGEPVGPVVELEQPLGGDPSRHWEGWRKRLGEADGG